MRIQERVIYSFFVMFYFSSVNKLFDEDKTYASNAQAFQ